MKRRDFIGGSLASVAVARSASASVPESTGSNELVEFQVDVMAKVVKPEAHSPGRVDLVVKTDHLIPSNVITLRIDSDGERDTYGKYASTQNAWLFEDSRLTYRLRLSRYPSG